MVDKFGHDWLVQSTAFHPDFLNLKLLEMLNAATLEEAVAIAHTAGMPTMNLILVDSEGNIGWTLMGGIPQRPLPASQRLMNHEEPWEWSGRVPARQIPRLINPGGGRIWSTNNRILGRQLVDLLGDGGYPYDGRDTVIHEKLHAADRFDETALLDIQLSPQTSVFDRWRAWLTQLETEGRWTPGQLPYPELWEDVLQNDGRALPESRGYFFLRRFRYQLAESVFNRLLGGINLKWTTFGFRWDEPLYQILTTSAGQQLDPEGSDWMNSLDEAFEETVNWLNSEYGSVERARWGARNQLRLKHPLSRALPVLSPLLDMPTREVPGDSYAPRVQGTAFGASQRMVVSPEHPEDGIFHMPTGQSGHFLSPFYRAGHTDWLEGRPSPLLPGTPRHRRTLVPGHPPDGPVSGNP